MMQRRISRTERRTNVLLTIEEKRTLIDTLNTRRWLMIKAHAETWWWSTQLNNGKNVRRNPIKRKVQHEIHQMMNVTSYEDLKFISNNREIWRKHLLWINQSQDRNIKKKQEVLTQVFIAFSSVRYLKWTFYEILTAK